MFRSSAPPSGSTPSPEGLSLPTPVTSSPNAAAAGNLVILLAFARLTVLSVPSVPILTSALRTDVPTLPVLLAATSRLSLPAVLPHLSTARTAEANTPPRLLPARHVHAPPLGMRRLPLRGTTWTHLAALPHLLPGPEHRTTHAPQSTPLRLLVPQYPHS